MFLKRLGILGLIGGLGLGAAACTDGYGYSGVGVGYGAAGGGYYDDGYGYGDSYYGGGGYGYGGAGYGSGLGYGWYNNYYYPGTGVYVYDRNRRAYRWNNGQQQYWRGRGGGNRDVRANWRDFGRDVRNERRDFRGDVRDNRQAYRNGTITQEQFRDGRRDARQEYRGDVRQDYRELRQQNRAEGVRTPRLGNRALRSGGRLAPRPRR